MIFFKEGTEKSIKRGALALKTLMIDDNVEIGNDVYIGLDAEKMSLVISNKSEEEVAEMNGKDAEVTLLVEEFAPVPGVTNHMEATVCGKYMLIELVSGALLITKPDSEEIMLVYRNVPDIDNLQIVLDKAKWISTEKFRGVLSNWGEFASSYVEDYSYELELSVDKDGVLNYKRLEVIDISQGMLDAERAKIEHRARLVESKKATRLMEVAKNSPSAELDEDDYEDDGCGSEYDEYDEYSDESYL